MNIRKQKPMRRGAGVLLPITSLPSPYGIGTFGAAAYTFVDFLREAGQRCWQVLPLGPTSYGDSPYQSFSAFAGNPYFIDLDLLAEEGLLTPEEIASYDWGDDPAMVDYAKIYESRFVILKRAFDRWTGEALPEYVEYCAENADWLEDYSLYMAVKMRFDGREWLAWPENIRLREPAAVEEYRENLREEIAFWRFCQYQFILQWRKLKTYANENGVEIMGDIPIYVALDSADVWAHGDQFQLDGDHRPEKVAGVPPDMFSADGQLWGNPLYDWARMECDGYEWWKRRMAFSARLYDIVRIDHFIGIVRYYAIPADESTAKNGAWVDGPGEGLIAAISSVMGEKRIVAEDLGILVPEVGRMLCESGYPGMKLMQFGFNSNGENEYLPCHYDKNSVIYGGTHDNETLVGYFSHREQSTLQFAMNYLDVSDTKEIPWALIRAGYASSANTAIFQMQDYMELDNIARMNTPSTIGENWRWRLTNGNPDAALAGKIRELADLYGR